MAAQWTATGLPLKLGVTSGYETMMLHLYFLFPWLFAPYDELMDSIEDKFKHKVLCSLTHSLNHSLIY